MAASQSQVRPQELAKRDSARDGLRLGLTSLAAATIQGLCAFLMLANSVKAVLGVTSAAAAGSASLIHSDPVRIPLMVLAATGAGVTLYVLWNGWRLRNRPEAEWRRRPLSPRERWMTAASLVSAVVTVVLILAELATHHRFHPS